MTQTVQKLRLELSQLSIQGVYLGSCNRSWKARSWKAQTRLLEETTG